VNGLISISKWDPIVCSEPLVWLFSLAWDAVIITLDVGFICPFVVIDPTYWGATTVVAPGRMIDNFLPISDALAESLSLYRMALKLACVSKKTRKAFESGCPDGKVAVCTALEVVTVVEPSYGQFSNSDSTRTHSLGAESDSGGWGPSLSKFHNHDSCQLECVSCVDACQCMPVGGPSWNFLPVSRSF
jgi:hypothetical protein